MKRIFLTLLSVLAITSATAAPKQKAQTFPDGTPMEAWFQTRYCALPGGPLDEPATGLSAEALEQVCGLKVYHLGRYGIYSTIQKVQTAAIQAVIDKAGESGGVVYVPEGIYKSGALFFPQGTHLYLAKGAVLLGSDDIQDFPPRTTRIEGQTCLYFPALVNADHLDGFSISGQGVIDGNGSEYWKAFRLRRQWNPKCTNKDEMRPRLMHMEHCRNVSISGVSLQNSPFWTCHLYKCEYVCLDNVRFFSPRFPIASASADGIDLDACSQVHISGCRLTVNDDAVCLKGGKGPYADLDSTNGPCCNILIENTLFDHTTGSCLTCGSECLHARNIVMRHCEVTGGSNLLLLKMRPDTPQRYEYITVDDVKGSCAGLFNVNRWTQFFDLQGREDIPMSYGEHIAFRNISLKCRFFIGGQADENQYRVSDVLMENVRVQTDHGQYDKKLINGLMLKNVSVGAEVEL